MRRQLFLFSPIKPLRTGTAHYFELLLQQIEQAPLHDVEVVIVVDYKFYGSQVTKYGGYVVKDYQEIERSPSDISVYFLANNEFHRYAHRALYDHKREYGKALSVVHEPCMWMNVSAMCNLHEYGFTESDISYFASYEFGDKAEFFSELFARSEVDKNFEYTSIAGTHIFERSDMVVFHSNFAREKFVMERSYTYRPERNDEPAYYVMCHPPEASLAAMEKEKNKPKFIAGMFGWIKSVKQAEEVIRAFAEFYDSVNALDRDKVGLYVVGQVDTERGFDPVGVARQTDARDVISLFGYVSDKEMDDLMAQTSVIFSLRFPSCGETSGPLYKAKALGVPVVLSDYAAFAEEPAEYHVPVEKTMQHKEIVRILKDEYSAFRKGQGISADYLTQPKGSPMMSIVDILDKAREL